MVNWNKKRYKKLLNILIKSEKVLTIEKLAEKFDVSKRTIRNDLDQINQSDVCKQNEITINKKRGVGVWLEISPEQKEKVIDIVYDIDDPEKKYSIEQRRKIILKQLLLTEDWITMSYFADKLYVSRATIFKDIAWVEEWLIRYDLKLERKRNRGIKIIGHEIRIREAIVNLLFDFLDRDDFDRLLYLLMAEKKINTKEFDLLYQFLGAVELQKIKNIVYDQITKRNYQFSNRAIFYLVLYIAISLKRIKNGNEVEEIIASGIIDKLYEIDFITEVMEMREKFSQTFSITVSSEELIATLAQFLCLELKKSYFKENKNELFASLEQQVLKSAEKFVEIINDDLNIELNKGKDWFLDLVLHINYIYNHSKYNVSRKRNFQFSNILLKELKSTQQKIFQTAVEFKQIFSKQYRDAVTKEDIEYIFVLLLSIIERKTEKSKAVFVCSKQNPLYKLVIAKLEAKLKCIKIINVLSYSEAKYQNYGDYDLIISCSDLENFSNNVVISPLVDNNDLKRILDKIN